MQIICIRKDNKRSGNHGRENNLEENGKQPTNGNRVSMKPQITQSGFVNPNTLTSKKTIPIKDVVKDSPTDQVKPAAKNEEKECNEETEVVDVVEKIAEKTTGSFDKETTEKVDGEVNGEVSVSEDVGREIGGEIGGEVDREVDREVVKEVRSEAGGATTESQSLSDVSEEEDSDLEESEVLSTDEQIPDHTTTPQTLSTDVWNEMLSVVFEKFPTIHHPLKDIPPDFQDNKIVVKVKSNIQFEHFKGKKNEVLAYLREHVKFPIDDISILVDANLETKKIIYDNKEKLDYLREENADISNFMEILKLTIKE